MTKTRLFCFPFAGGSKYSYSGFFEHAPLNVEIVPLEIPGRGSRLNEPLLYSIDEIVEDCLLLLRDNLNEPYCLYGHSMGTLIVYRLTKRILELNWPIPKYLFVSGRGGPSVEKEVPIHALPKVELMKEVSGMGGSPKDLLENDELFNFFEPILRADLFCSETFDYTDSEPFNIPILVMIGTRDAHTLEQAKSWQKESLLPIAVKQFHGNHFFIFENKEEIMQLIGNAIHSVTKQE